MYYTIKTIDTNNLEIVHEKINHSTAIEIINQLLSSYGFTKSITKNTFNNILTRPGLVPDRLKYLINTNKLLVSRYNIPAPLNLEGLARAMYG
jgi:hypothetical protein